jgi:hypothetical protein
MKTIVLLALGAFGYHLYVNDQARDQLVYDIKHSVSTTADRVADTTRPDLIDHLRNR